MIVQTHMDDFALKDQLIIDDVDLKCSLVEFEKMKDVDKRKLMLGSLLN